MAENGRPPKYKPEYCDMLIEHMKSGLGYESFAAVCDAYTEMLYHWERQYPEFATAKKKAFSFSNLYIDQKFAECVENTKMQAVPLIFLAKNRFHNQYKDNHTIELSKNVNKMTDEELMSEIESLKKQLTDAET